MFADNTVFEWEDKQYRLLKNLNGRCALFPMDAEKKALAFTLYSTDELEKAESEGALSICHDPYYVHRTSALQGIPGERARAVYEKIESLLDPNLLFNPRLMREKIKEVQEKFSDESKKLSVIQIRRWLACWWRKGQALGALIPEYGHNKGKRTYTKVPGRPRADSDTPILDDRLKKDMKAACRKYLTGPDKLSVSKAHAQLRADLTAKYGADTPCPTEMQLRYFYKTAFKAKERSEGLADEAVYNRDIRPLTGSALSTVNSIGAVYEIDSTPADFALVSSEDPTQVVGRPTLYTVVDRFSGMITGFHATMDPAGGKAAFDALYNAIIDKERVARKYGIPFDRKDWPCEGVPAKIVADNAEFQADQVRYIEKDLETTVELTASRRADQKGTCERSLGLIQEELRAEISSRVAELQKAKKAGGIDKRPEAVLDINAFRKMVYNAVRVVNKRVREMTPRGYPPQSNTPEAIWNWAKKRGNSLLRAVCDPQKARLTLMPHYAPTVSKEGFKADGIAYLCDEALQRGCFERGSVRESIKGVLVIDPGNVGNAWFVEDKTSETRKCRLAPSSEHLEGMTKSEADDYIAKARAAQAQAKQEQSELRARLVAEQRLITQECRNKQEEELEKLGKTKKDMVKGVSEGVVQERRADDKNHPRTENPVTMKTIRAEPEPKAPKKRYKMPTRMEDLPDD